MNISECGNIKCGSKCALLLNNPCCYYICLHGKCKKYTSYWDVVWDELLYVEDYGHAHLFSKDHFMIFC